MLGKCFSVEWTGDRWTETPSTKSQAHWQIEKLARWTLGCRRLEEIQKKSTWPHQVFTSAASTEGIWEESRTRNPDPHPWASPLTAVRLWPSHRAFLIPFAPLLPVPLPQPKMHSHLRRIQHKSLRALMAQCHGQGFEDHRCCTSERDVCHYQQLPGQDGLRGARRLKQNPKHNSSATLGLRSPSVIRNNHSISLTALLWRISEFIFVKLSEVGQIESSTQGLSFPYCSDY